MGIPLLYAILLFRERHLLSNAAEMKKEEENGFPNVGYVKFLITPYANAAFFFEVIECVRRLSLAAVIGVVSSSSGAAPVMGLLITLVFSIVFAYTQPLQKEDTILGIVLSYSLVLLFLAALMAKTDTSEESQEDQETFGTLMIVILFSGPATPFIQAILGAVLKRLPSESSGEKDDEEEKSEEVEMKDKEDDEPLDMFSSHVLSETRVELNAVQPAQQSMNPNPSLCSVGHSDSRQGTTI